MFVGFESGYLQEYFGWSNISLASMHALGSLKMKSVVSGVLFAWFGKICVCLLHYPMIGMSVLEVLCVVEFLNNHYLRGNKEVR